MSYGKIASYFFILIAGWTIASWYYGEEIAQLERDYITAKADAVERTIDQHNALAEEDRGLLEGFFSEQIQDADYFAKLKQEAGNVKTVNGCFVSNDIVRLWNSANRGNKKTSSTGANSLHGSLHGRIAAIQTLDFRSQTIFKGVPGQPHFVGKGISHLPEKTKKTSRVD